MTPKQVIIMIIGTVTTLGLLSHFSGPSSTEKSWKECEEKCGISTCKAPGPPIICNTKVLPLVPKHMIKVAIVDTGLNLTDARLSAHLCASGHKNFTGHEGIHDFVGHGTHVASLIEYYAGSSNYCLLIYKYYDNDATNGKINLQREILAFKEAIKNHADIINFSANGPKFSIEEYLIIKQNPQVTFVVSAGNDGKDLDILGNETYPASLFLPNEEVVMNRGRSGFRVLNSNYSSKTQIYEIGENVLGLLPNGKLGYMSGTSMAAAIHTGKLISKFSK